MSLILSALMLTGCALTPVFEDCSFKEGQILKLKAEIEQAEGWSGPPSTDPMRTHFLFREEGALKAKDCLSGLVRRVSHLEAERNIITCRLCEDGWLRVEIRFSDEGLFSSDSAWFLADSFQ